MIKLSKDSVEDEVVQSSQKIRDAIVRNMRKAKRSGLWYRIGRIERGILELSCRVDVKFRSMNLLRAIVKVVKELAQMGSFAYQNYNRGLKVACKMAKFAAENGYEEALSWMKERHYVVWWGIFINPKTYVR